MREKASPGAGFLFVDEVGRGSLFGPMTLGAVFLDSNTIHELNSLPFISEIRDSKELSAKQRQKLSSLIPDHFPAFTTHISVGYIDGQGLARALEYGVYRLYRQAVMKNFKAEGILMDGRARFGHFTMPAPVFLPKADSLLKSVGAASIIAKVKRDQLISTTASRFPGYGLERNMGYGTREHREAILQLGPTHFHRKLFLRKILGKG